MSTDAKHLARVLEEGLAELGTMRDEIRVKLHLATMDARQLFEELEPQFRTFEADTRAAGEAAWQAAKASLEELRAAYRRLRDGLDGTAP